MNKVLCHRCLTFNARSARHCSLCETRLKTSWWFGLQRKDPLERSPFSIDRPHHVSNDLVVNKHYNHPSSRPYRLLSLSMLLIGASAAYVRLNPIPTEEEDVSTPPLTNTAQRPNIVVQAPQAARINLSSTSMPSLSDLMNHPEKTFARICREAKKENYSAVPTVFVHPSSYTPPNPRLFQLQFKQAPSPRIKAQVAKVYEQWKQEHTKSIEEVKNFVSLYSPQATIKCRAYEFNPQQLGEYVTKSRKYGTFRHVSDVTAPEWACDSKTAPRYVEVLAYHHYQGEGKNNVTYTGQRHLIWEKQGQEWKIISDEYPPFYTRPNWF